MLSLKEALETSKTLQSISIANTNLTYEGIPIQEILANTIDLKMLTRGLNKWMSIKEIDVSYNNLDLDSVKLISTLMKSNRSITQFEMAPLLDMRLTESEESLLEGYFNALDYACHQNLENLPHVEYQYSDEDPKRDSFPDIARSQMKSQKAFQDSPGSSHSNLVSGVSASPSLSPRSSMMAQKRFSIQMQNLQRDIVQARETLDTFDAVLERGSNEDHEKKILQVRLLQSIEAHI